MILLALFISSCIPAIDVSYETQKSISISEMQATKISTNIGSTTTCNAPSTMACKYTIYKLPYPQTTDYASQIKLSVIIDDPKLWSNNNGYFAVIVNASDQEKNIYNYIQNYTYDGTLHSMLHEPFTIGKRTSSSRVLANTSKRTPKEQYDLYCDKDDRRNDRCTEASTRMFFFGHGTQRPHDGPVKPVETILRKKIHLEVDGRDLYFAFWIEKDKSFPAFFTEELNIKFKELYTLLYKLNKSHIWGKHPFDNNLVGDSVIHIALGTIQNTSNQTGVVMGFVDPRTTYYNITSPQNYQPEEEIAPTIYLDVNPTSTKSTKVLEKFYSTLAHELQHVFTNYKKTVLESHSVQATLYQVDTWIHEFLALAIQHLTEYKAVEWANYDANIKEKYAIYSYINWYKGSDTILQTTSLTSNKNFTANSYKIGYLFVSYLINNYGLEVITKALNNEHKNHHTLVQAVKKTDKYAQLPSELQPKTIEDILAQFFTAIFTSNIEYKFNQEGHKEGHNYKFFISSDSGNTESFLLSHKSIGERKTINITTLSDELRITSTTIAPQYKISPFNIIFDAEAQNQDNPNYTLTSGKHGVAYLGGRLNNNGDSSKAGVFKTTNEGYPYFTLTLNSGSAATFVIAHY